MVGFVMRSGGSFESHPVECFFAQKGGESGAQKEGGAQKGAEGAEKTNALASASEDEIVSFAQKEAP